MKNLILTGICGLLLMTAPSCSSTRDTKKADPTATKNKAMRHRNQAVDPNTPGHQKDEVRQMTK